MFISTYSILEVTFLKIFWARRALLAKKLLNNDIRHLFFYTIKFYTLTRQVVSLQDFL